MLFTDAELTARAREQCRALTDSELLDYFRVQPPPEDPEDLRAIATNEFYDALVEEFARLDPLPDAVGC